MFFLAVGQKFPVIIGFKITLPAVKLEWLGIFILFRLHFNNNIFYQIMLVMVHHPLEERVVFAHDEFPVSIELKSYAADVSDGDK